VENLKCITDAEAATPIGPYSHAVKARGLRSSGSDLPHVIRCGVYLTDIRDFERMNSVYASVFDSHRPARTTVQVAALPAPDLRVEIDCVAAGAL
jgi:enamine deaminase RidA (YjgF/YER057c/UK114 family)